MTYTSQFPATFDGIRLDTLAYGVETISGEDFVPGVRNNDIPLPGRHGSLPILGKKFDNGRFIQSMWVIGSDVDGGIPAGGRRRNEFRKNLDTLKALFGKRNALMAVVADIGDGTKREAQMQCLDAIDFSVRGVNPIGRFAVILDIPAVFWQDQADVNYDSLTGVTTSWAATLSAFAGATGIMEDLYIVVDGPINYPKLIDNATGHYIQLQANLAAGNQWVVNTSLWTSKTGAGIAFTQSGTDQTAATVFSGQHNPRYFAVSPVNTSQVTAPALTLTNTGGSTSATRLRVRGRRKFL